MSKTYKQNPYNGFKSDIERRRALNFKAACLTVSIITTVLSDSHLLKLVILWLNRI